MEMNFPHLDLMIGAQKGRQDFRALISKAISGQGNSATARMMVAADHNQTVKRAGDIDPISERIQYFAAALHGSNHGNAPFGSFFPTKNRNNSNVTNCNQAVYQDNSANRKDIAVNIHLLDLQASHPGHNPLRHL